MDSCFFCDDHTQNTDIVYRGELFYARYDKFPVTAGHLNIVTMRHVADFTDLTSEEWIDLQRVIKIGIHYVSRYDTTGMYQKFVANAYNEKSAQMCQEVLDSGNCSQPVIDTNQGFNNGTLAGRTIDHFHWHVIPRYDGDMSDPRGGVRHVIPERGNYKL